MDHIDTSIKVGDRVRSYDFEGNTECYVEGTVENIAPAAAPGHYYIRVEKRVFNGEETRKPYPSHVYPPKNGTPMWGRDEVTNFVVKVNENQQS